MIQRAFYFLCSALFLCIASQNQVAGQVAPFQPFANPAAQVYLTASGKDGSPAIPAQSELLAFVYKQPAQITSLHSAKDDNLLFALLVDTSTSQAPNAESIRKAATLLFQGLSTGGNQGYLVAFDTQALMSNRPLQPSEARDALNGLKFGGATASDDAIGDTCTRILSRSKNPDFPRRAIFLITDGEDNQSRINRTKAAEIAVTEGIEIFSLATPHSASSGKRNLNEISNNTGGKAILDKKLEEGVEPLLTAINEQWVLSLVPSQASDKKWHSLVIETTQRDVSLSTPAKVFLH
jgi:Mg-chelatase subunit ChlD